MRHSLILGLVLAGLAVPAVAQERSFNFALGGGVAAVPDYPGSDDYSAVPDLGFTFGSLKWGAANFGNGIGAVPDNGFSVRGAFKIRRDRKAEDHRELTGLKDIDTAVELGLGVAYQQTNYMVFGEVRQGFGGHSGVTGTLGADVIIRPDNRWTFTAGPRINLGDSEYASTYFDVSPTEAAASRFAAYDADGGILGAGISIGATYQIDDRWAMESQFTYEKLMNAAEDSPITANGSDDQITLSIGLSRAFTLRF